MFGNRAIYHDGWTATAKHRTPWAPGPGRPLAEDTWELYHVAEGLQPGARRRGAAPEKLEGAAGALQAGGAQVQRAARSTTASYERFNAAIAGRPDLMGDRKSLTLYPGMTRIMENAFINVKNRSHTITAEVEVPANGNGVIICQGGKFAGWSLYMKDGKTGVHAQLVRPPALQGHVSEAPFPPASVTLKYEFTYEGG